MRLLRAEPEGIIRTTYTVNCGTCDKTFENRACTSNKKQFTKWLLEHQWKVIRYVGWMCPKCLNEAMSSNPELFDYQSQDKRFDRNHRGVTADIAELPKPQLAIVGSNGDA